MRFENCLFIIFLLITVGIALSGCATRPAVTTTDESIVSGQIGVTKLQTINAGLRDILQVYDEQIARQIGYSVRGIDDAIAALDRYDEFVQRLIRKIRGLELATRAGERESQGAE